MTYKLIVFDKDGTLVQPKSGDMFVRSPIDQELIPGVAERLKELAIAPIRLAIATNQGGVAAGHKTLDEAIAEVDYAIQIANTVLDDGFRRLRVAMVAPSYESEQGEAYRRIVFRGTGGELKSLFSRTIRYRKPEPGMIQALASYYCISLKHVLMIGDRPEDQQAAINAGVDFCWAADWIAHGLPIPML